MIFSRYLLTLVSMGALGATAQSEDLECRWFIPTIGRTLPVRCDEARTERIILGLTLSPLDQNLKASFGIAAGSKGVIVTNVIEDSEAAGRGIVRGDIILRTSAGLISSPDDFVQSIETATKEGQGSIGLFVVDRSGATEFVSLKLI